MQILIKGAQRAHMDTPTLVEDKLLTPRWPLLGLIIYIKKTCFQGACEGTMIVVLLSDSILDFQFCKINYVMPGIKPIEFNQMITFDCI